MPCAGLRVAGLILLFLVCLPPHLLSQMAAAALAAGRRASSPPPRGSSGARVRVAGDPLRPHSLLSPITSSWLDILVLGGATGCAFVSKDDARPRLGPLARRPERHAVHPPRPRAARAPTRRARSRPRWTRPQPLALFPEGTTGPGDRSAAVPLGAARRGRSAAAGGRQVRPVALDYGAAAREVGWYGESGKDNVLRILGRQGTLADRSSACLPAHAAAAPTASCWPHQARERDRRSARRFKFRAGWPIAAAT